jgi:hypothetical protein
MSPPSPATRVPGQDSKASLNLEWYFRSLQGEKALLEEQSTVPEHVSADVEREPPRERRDVQRMIDVWQQNRSADGSPPLLAKFDFSRMKGDWAYRFLICSDPTVANSVFALYGPKFAQQFALPDKATSSTPAIDQIPERYRPIFVDGCSKAIAQQAPARLSGSFKSDIQIELYRSVFMPIILQPHWSKQLVLGSFNSITVLAVDRVAP